jgi:probable F420-dependent oxidoreductase
MSSSDVTGAGVPEVVRGARERLGSVGVWLGSLRPASVDQERRAARRIEELGYGSLWSGEGIGGKEAFAHMALLLSSTERIVAGIGIANLWARHPATMQGGGATLGAAWPGRFVLGVGVSHAVMVTRSGQDYEKPLAHTARYLREMDEAASDAPATAIPVPRVLAALRPKMLELSRDHADGAHPYFVPPAHTRLARKILGPDRLLIPEQAVALAGDADEGRPLARQHMELYLRLPNYVNNLRHLGYTDDDLSNGGSDRLVDDIVAWGDPETVAVRVQEHLDGGADHVVLQPLGDLDAAVRQLEVLAPVLLAG